MKAPLLFPLMLVAGLVACQPSAQAPLPTGDDAHAITQQEMEKASMNFDKVLVVRLSSEGKRVEVTSVMPAVIAQAKVGNATAKTIFRINDARDALVMFTRDLPKGTSYRTELKLSELESRKSLVFPVLQPDGRPADRQFSLEQIVIPQ